jgi:hypothetical protein
LNGVTRSGTAKPLARHGRTSPWGRNSTGTTPRSGLIDAAEAERIGLINRAVPGDHLAAEVDALAGKLARVPPDVMAPTKLMLNRAMDAAGFAAAVEMGLDLQSFVNMSDTAREFDAIVRREGLKAALAWRDRRYEERLGGRGSD